MPSRCAAPRPASRRAGRLWCAVPLALVVGCASGHKAQPNPPEWPDSVFVWGPEDDAGEIEAVVNEAFQHNGGHDTIDHGQFSPKRFAFMFKPGTYHVDVPVGYYTQVLGLGTSPDDVVFDAARGVYSEEGDQTDLGGSLSTFWRSGENFRNTAEMLWAVSQAAPLRRVVVEKSLNLAQFVDGVGMGYSSGGYLGNCRVKGMVNSASQQQWFSRNLQVEAWPQGNWNMVFVGVNGAPASACGREGDAFPSTNVQAAPVIAEKPFITIGEDGKYSLQIPQLKHDREGYDFDAGKAVPFEKVYVAKPFDSAAQINKHLRMGLHCVLSPGTYHLEAALELNHADQVLLGLGLATLEATKGTAAVKVGNVDGVRVAGVLLQAGSDASDVLLEWGDGAYKGNADNPGVMSDLFARVGGPNDPDEVQAEARVMVRIRSSHVIGDNLWLWRADHGVAGIVKASMNPCDHGLVVLGDHVTMYGLAVEHTLKDLVQWAGNAGRTYFFQSELPYDVGQDFGDADFVGYRVNDSVSTHNAYGVGVYHFFRDFQVVVPRGIACPPWLENSFENPLSVSLTGKGTISHVINDKGEPTQGDASTAWYCEKGPDIEPDPVKTTPPPKTTAPRTKRTTTRRAATTARPGSGERPASPSSAGKTCSKGWAKCGGKKWDGPTCCEEEYTCVEQGSRGTYWQCIPEKKHKWDEKDRLSSFNDVLADSKLDSEAAKTTTAPGVLAEALLSLGDAAKELAEEELPSSNDEQRPGQDSQSKGSESKDSESKDSKNNDSKSKESTTKGKETKSSHGKVKTQVLRGLKDTALVELPGFDDADPPLPADLAPPSEHAKSSEHKDHNKHKSSKASGKPWSSPWATHKIEEGLFVMKDEAQHAPVATDSEHGPFSRWAFMLLAAQVGTATAFGVICWVQRQRRRDSRVSIRAAPAESQSAGGQQSGMLLARSPITRRGPPSPGMASPMNLVSSPIERG